MSDLKTQQRIQQATHLRVYYGDEDSPANPQGEARHDFRLCHADMTTEAYWAGRSPAARHSARIVA